MEPIWREEQRGGGVGAGVRKGNMHTNYQGDQLSRGGGFKSSQGLKNFSFSFLKIFFFSRTVDRGKKLDMGHSLIS